MTNPGHRATMLRRRLAAALRPFGSPGESRRMLRAARAAAGDFLRRVWVKADQDKIFFMAGAIAFNILVAIVPLALAAIGIAGMILQQRYQAEAGRRLVEFLLQALPPVSEAFTNDIARTLNSLLAKSGGFTTVGIALLVWLATRLVGTLRTVLREVFDIQQDRSIIAGKIFDIQMVVVAGTLLGLNVGLTIVLNLLSQFSVDVLGMPAYRLRQNIVFPVIAFISIWTMFLLMYRYLPGRRIQWRTSLIAASFTAVLFELLKQAFAWYVNNFAEFGSTYGNFAFVAIVVIYVYYMAIVFILG
ncbi:MAG: YihY/virulence factor BrkB family protein, partial [Gemmatimonadetes bacterium]|nr:YihY/virulence factor BrkB family protein [Gemmatimonadota bacterium]